MVVIELPAEASRKLIDLDLLVASAETRNVFGLSQHIDLSHSKGGAAVVALRAPQVGLTPVADMPAIRESQREAVLASVRKYPDSVHVQNAAGQTLLSLGDTERAIESFRRALQLDSTHRVARLNLARALMMVGDYQEAEGHYRTLLQDNQAADSKILMNLAQLMLRTNRLGEAEELLTAAIRMTPEDAGAYNERAVIRIIQRRTNQAIQDLRSALRLDVRFPSAHNNLGVCFLMAGSPNRALSSFRAALKLDRTNGDAALNFAVAAVPRGLTSEAIDVLGEYVAIHSSDLRAFDALARLYIIAKQPARSLGLFERLLQEAKFNNRREECARLQNNTGVAYMFLDKLDAAAEHFRLSIAEGPIECTPYCNLAEVLLRRGRIEEAHSVLENALDLYREDHRALQMFGAYYVRKDLPEAAVECLRRTLNLNPSDGLTYAWLGSILSDAMNRHDEAVRVLRDGLRASPESALLKNNLAYVLLMKGAITEARQVLDSVDRAEGQEQVFLTATRGLLAIRQGDLQEGRRLYNLASRLATDPDTRSLVLQKKAVELARAYSEAGEVNRAKGLLREARRITNTSHKLFLHQAERLEENLGGSPARQQAE